MTRIVAGTRVLPKRREVSKNPARKGDSGHGSERDAWNKRLWSSIRERISNPETNHD
jgi:hypothetical protein